MISASNVTEKRGNIEIEKNYIEKGNCVKVWKIMKWFLENNTDPIPHLHPFTDTRMPGDQVDLRLLNILYFNVLLWNKLNKIQSTYYTF